MAMRPVRSAYTWRLSLADLGRLDPSERRAAEMVAASEPDVRAYLTASIRDRDERQEAILDALAAAFEGIRRDSTAESTRILALMEARKRSAISKARQRYVASRPEPDQWGTGAANIDAAAVQSYHLRLWVWFEPVLASLRQQERLALELHVAEGKSDKDIAIELHCRPATVRKLRERAGNALRRAVEREEVPQPPETP
jgi:DNA-directed RNA polymerase specialized sigma24 family protein